ncbi:STAS domain-containing protein [Oleiagrimonas sp. C23AA]|nr:STAS domain-containing protein [Oleiagrimonas sp. C23AA]NII11747.1 STAS domain-containing protein [Oleiagrimonas sp. C23AA]
MSIYRAAELKDELLKAFDSGPALCLDLSQVAEFDTAGLQLLILLARLGAAGGKAFHVTAASEAVNDVFALLGYGAAQDGDWLSRVAARTTEGES